jgi:hypothetical protein
MIGGAMGHVRGLIQPRDIHTNALIRTERQSFLSTCDNELAIGGLAWRRPD